MTQSIQAFPEAEAWAEGCEAHRVSVEAAARRWATVEALVASTPEDDHAAQWSVIGACGCCMAPTKLPDVFCTRCQGEAS